MTAEKDAGPCWCRSMLGFVTHPADEPCPTRAYWLDVDDSEFPIPPEETKP